MCDCLCNEFCGNKNSKIFWGVVVVLVALAFLLRELNVIAGFSTRAVAAAIVLVAGLQVLMNGMQMKKGKKR
jgi:uncharacterized membrane protein